MAKRESFLRYMLIVSKLRKSKASFDEILSFLDAESQYRGYDLSVSKRTFQRDIQDIASLFDIEICFDRKQGNYYIEYDETDKNRERIIEALDVFHALNMSDRLSAHIHFENAQSLGTKHLYGLLHAIKNRFQIEVAHKKYWDCNVNLKIVEPLGIREFKRRWYLVAYEVDHKKIKVYGLDRIVYFDILQQQFDRNFDAYRHFGHCFGVIRPDEGKPETIELSFDSFQGLYIKALPIHHSQEILADNDREFRIRLKLFITHELIMELLSYGDTLQVLKPASLAKQIHSVFACGVNTYENKNYTPKSENVK
jgi:predicted DNA-binding transcriptional regulator YafY